jgi:hypothetical protein
VIAVTDSAPSIVVVVVDDVDELDDDEDELDEELDDELDDDELDEDEDDVVVSLHSESASSVRGPAVRTMFGPQFAVTLNVADVVVEKTGVVNVTEGSTSASS